MRQKNQVGGGAQTNVNGLHFEQTTNLRSILESLPSFAVKGDVVFKNGKEVALLCGKGKLYKNVLEPRGVNVREVLAKKLLPDDAILVSDTVYIIEKKFQSGPGSVDEKLQTCDFKKKQYEKLFSPLGIKVEYIYVFSDWFRKSEYKDVHDYIHSVGCKYFFNEIPLAEIGL